MIPFISAIFLKNKGSIVEKRDLLILFSLCYVSLQTLDNFLGFTSYFYTSFERHKHKLLAPLVMHISRNVKGNYYDAQYRENIVMNIFSFKMIFA